MKEEKLIAAIGSAVDNLEEAMKVLIKGDERETLRRVWRAAADSEYALFLFSIDSNASPEASYPWKFTLNPKNMEMEPALTLAQELLKEAEGNIRTGNLQEAHRKTWMTRGYLLGVQGILEKRHRDSKKSHPNPL
jgi:hypothetical protein